MAHRRARKDAAKQHPGKGVQGVHTISSNLDEAPVQLVNVPMVKLMPPSQRKIMRGMKHNKRAGGPGLTKPHPIATKQSRRGASKQAKASRKANR